MTTAELLGLTVQVYRCHGYNGLLVVLFPSVECYNILYMSRNHTHSILEVILIAGTAALISLVFILFYHSTRHKKYKCFSLVSLSCIKATGGSEGPKSC